MFNFFFADYCLLCRLILDNQFYLFNFYIH